MKKRIVVLALALSMLLSLLVGCGSSKEPSSQTSTPPSGNASQESPPPGEIVSTRDILTVGGAAEPATLDPINQQSMIVSQMAHLMYNTLFTMDPSYNVVGDLVESYENVSDTEWHFTIYKGIKFHDGTDLTTEDIKATLEYVQTNDYSSTYVASIASIKIEDDYNFTIITSYPDTALLPNFCQAGTSILPSEKLAAGWDFNAEPCGSGPYEFVSWSKGDNLTYKAFNDYFKGAPHIENLVWKFIPESSSRTIALEAGEIDFLFDPATIDLATLDAEDGITVQGTSSLNLYQLAFNYETLDWYHDANVRMAIRAAIDREAIVAAALNGYGAPAYGTAPNGLAGENLSNTVTSRDVDLAKQYLAASGYDPADLSFTIWTYEGERALAAQVIKSNLADIGIDVTIEIGEQATILTESSLGNFEAYIHAVANTSAIDYIRRLYSTDQIGASNTSRYSDPELDARIESIIAILDTDERVAAIYDLEGDLNDLCLYIPLYNDAAYRAYNSALQGVNFNGAYFTQYHEFYWAD